jgi:hypothetical protein
MIKLPLEIKLQYDLDVTQFENEIKRLKHKAKIAKKSLFAKHLFKFEDNFGSDKKIEFVNQFSYFLTNLTLFPDEDIIQKLREYKFSNSTLKWFVNLEDILSELDRLSKIDGLFFLPNAWLFAIQSHLENKVFISLIESFELDSIYNNKETNIIFEDYSKRYRRREYNEQKGQTPKSNWFERVMNKKLDALESAVEDNKGLAKNIVLKLAQSDTSLFLEILNGFHVEGIPKNKVYFELFPLLKLILKDKNILSEEEFSQDENAPYDADYIKYKIAKVRKILLKKQSNFLRNNVKCWFFIGIGI